MKIAFATFYDFLKGTKEPVCLNVIRKTEQRHVPLSSVPLSSYFVVLTTRLETDLIGEYRFEVGVFTEFDELKNQTLNHKRKLSSFNKRELSSFNDAFDLADSIQEELRGQGFFVINGAVRRRRGISVGGAVYPEGVVS